MPDLTIEHFWCCPSCEHFQTKIGEYTVTYGQSHNSLYSHDWSCECKGYKFRRKCKHINLAKEQWCGWNQYIMGNDPDRKGDNIPICPECGEVCISQAHGV